MYKYKAIAIVVWFLQLFFHLGFIQYLINTIPPDANVLWAFPFALAYALFMGIGMGVIYHYVLPEKSKIYWED